MCFTSSETRWYYSCIRSSSAKENSAANCLSPAGLQLLRHMSFILPLHPKNLYHCKGVSPPLHAWGIAWLLLKVFRHCWRWCFGPLKSYRLSSWNCHWERMLHDTDSFQVRLMGGWLPVLPVVVEHNHKPGIFPHDVASSLSGLFPKLSLLRRAGRLLGSYSIHCPSVLPHDDQGCSLLHQNISLTFRTSIWAQYNEKSFFPFTIPGPYWNAIGIGGQYLKQTFPSEYFQEAWLYSLKDSSGCSRAFQSVHWNCSTHKTTRSRNVDLIEPLGFHMSTTWRDPVSVISMTLERLHV